MNEYKRWISYLYEYVKGEKKDNSGFLRVEVRGPLCRIRIGLTGLRAARDDENKVYIMAAGEEGIREIFLGVMPCRNINREGMFQTRSGDMAGSGLPWKAFSGVRICCEKSGREYRTYWDDRILMWERSKAREKKENAEIFMMEDVEITEEGEGLSGEKIAAEENYDEEYIEVSERGEESDREIKSGEENEPTVENESEEENEPVEEKEIEEENEPVEEKEMGEEFESVEKKVLEKEHEPAEEKEPEEEYQPAEEKIPGKKHEQLEADKSNTNDNYWEPMIRGQEPQVTWSQFQGIYPKILPFGPGDPWEVMRIGLQDIGRLPREYWTLGANEFVIHGYYDYGHLALIRDETGEYCYLGIPGYAMEADRRVAELFGFRQYRPAEQVGYWLTRIKL